MTAPVDVLAVMDREIRSVAYDVKNEQAEPDYLAKLCEARDAVAELIEAGQYVADYVLNYSALTYSPFACKEAGDRLRDAIARAGGAK